MAHKTYVDATAYDITGGRTMVDGTGYNVTGGRTLVDGTAYDISFFSVPALNDCTWTEISEISSAGLASSCWSVGDRKAVTLRGVIGILSIDETYYVYIIGFNHKGATNTIDFGTFKTTLSGGRDICLIDENYPKSSTNGTKYFNMKHSSTENNGGWKGCDLRYDILGSTKTKGSNADSNTATSPVPNTLMAALPSDLRAVMKPMTIYTDNIGGKTVTDSNVTASVDYLPLLAEFEIFGTRSNANPAEQNYQEQYTYFSSGNSRYKVRHSALNYAARWWARSPQSYNAFCTVSDQIEASGVFVNGSAGLAPIFRV